MHTLKVLTIFIILAFGIASCAKPQTTDIDYIAKSFLEQHDGFEFIADCKKPKAFRGIGKFRVSCIVSKTENAWKDSYSKSHSGWSYSFGGGGYRFIGSTNLPGEYVQIDNSDQDIHVFNKAVKKTGCNRRIYIDYRELRAVEGFDAPAGTTIYIADPWKVICSKATKTNGSPESLD